MCKIPYTRRDLDVVFRARSRFEEAFDRTGRRVFCSTDKNVLRADLNAVGSTAPPSGEQCAGFSALQ